MVLIRGRTITVSNLVVIFTVITVIGITITITITAIVFTVILTTVSCRSSSTAALEHHPQEHHDHCQSLPPFKFAIIITSSSMSAWPWSLSESSDFAPVLSWLLPAEPGQLELEKMAAGAAVRGASRATLAVHSAHPTSAASAERTGFAWLRLLCVSEGWQGAEGAHELEAQSPAEWRAVLR